MCLFNGLWSARKMPFTISNERPGLVIEYSDEAGPHPRPHRKYITQVLGGKRDVWRLAPVPGDKPILRVPPPPVMSYSTDNCLPLRWMKQHTYTFGNYISSE